jgi:lysophospholipase L1-like esterase
MRFLVNDSIRAYYHTFADGIADVALDPLMGVDGMNPNPNPYYGDGIHPTGEGEAILAPYFADALREFGGSTAVLER